jgi:5-methylcytosine-specific restriction endonuclease McrA
MSACVDHIIPVAKGGHPSALENLQLAHWTCNRQKSDKLYREKREPKVVGNRNLPQSKDWANYEAN